MANDQIHGHEVIDLVRQHPEGIAAADLAARVAQKFGPDARFFTCSTEGMTLDQLLRFLSDRHKVEARDGALFPGGSPACNHG